MNSQIEQRDPRSLKNHLLNIELYGTHPLPEFVGSIKAHGVLAPLTISTDGTIISGHSRRAAAIVAGLEMVPCVVSPLTDPDEIERALIESNRQREKTNEQKAREAMRLLEIEKRLAEKRRRANLRQGISVPEWETFPTRENLGENANSSRAADMAGKVVGMSGKTVTKAVEVVAKIDAAKARGDAGTAQKLTKTLNEKGVAPAFHEARETDYESNCDHTDGVKSRQMEATDGDRFDRLDDRPGESSRVAEALELGREFDSINREVRGSIRKIKALGEKSGGVWLDGNKLQEIEVKIGNGLSAFLGAKPHARCPYCGGKGCRGCRESGYVTRMIFDSAPERLRKPAVDAAVPTRSGEVR